MNKLVTQAESAARAIYAAKRKREGATFQDIADELQVNKERARAIVARGERMLNESNQ